jgi:hypothetical protein
MAVRLSAWRAGRPLPPGRFLVFISVRGWIDPRAVVRLEGLGQLTNMMTISRIETETFRLVAQCLNQLRYRVPPLRVKRLHNFYQNAIAPLSEWDDPRYRGFNLVGTGCVFIVMENWRKLTRGLMRFHAGRCHSVLAHIQMYVSLYIQRTLRFS